MMFDHAGYSYLRFIWREFNDKPQLLARIREVMQRGEQPRIVTACPTCGTPATHIVAAGDDREGFSFEAEGWCEAHCPEEHRRQKMPLKFSSVARFVMPSDQASFLKNLRDHCGLGRERLTAERACDFFFPA